jgi:hypothetical protein
LGRWKKIWKEEMKRRKNKHERNNVKKKRISEAAGF